MWSHVHKTTCEFRYWPCLFVLDLLDPSTISKENVFTVIVIELLLLLNLLAMLVEIACTRVDSKFSYAVFRNPHQRC